MYKQALETHGSIRKAAQSLNLSKSKFMVLYKKELGLCTATTGCQNTTKEGRTRCVEHLKYAVETRDEIKKRIYTKKYYWENVEHFAEYNKEYQSVNLDRYRKGNKKYLNTEKGRAQNNEKRARRRFSQKSATPPWINKKELQNIYRMCPEGFHVDHIIPLHNENVSGLHVPANLQYLSSFENESKGAKFDGTYENISWKKDLPK